MPRDEKTLQSQPFVGMSGRNVDLSAERKATEAISDVVPARLLRYQRFAVGDVCVGYPATRATANRSEREVRPLVRPPLDKSGYFVHDIIFKVDFTAQKQSILQRLLFSLLIYRSEEPF